MKLDLSLEDDCWWKTKVVLPEWADCKYIEDEDISQDKPLENTPGSIEIVFAPEGRDSSLLTESEILKITWFIENSIVVSNAVMESIYEAYPSLKEEYGYSQDEREDYMPDISSISDLKELISRPTINIHQIEKDTIPYIGFEFECKWDPEHGLGVLMNGTRTVKIGGADTAFTLWIAERDQEQP
jgi:hypothetical protein